MTMRPPLIPPTIPPHVVPGVKRVHADSLLGLLELLRDLGIVVIAGAGDGGGSELVDTPTIEWDFSTPGEAKANVVGGAGVGMTPTRIAAGETFTVPVDRQALYALPIDVEGALVVDGVLIMVD